MGKMINDEKCASPKVDKNAYVCMYIGTKIIKK